MKKKVFNVAVNIIFYTMLIVGILIGYRNVTCSPIVVNGSSMAPTLSNGDYGYAKHTQFALNHIDRFDIIVFHYDLNGEETNIIKRVIGLPGEKLMFDSECNLFVDDNEIKQDFISEELKRETSYRMTSSFHLNKEFKVPDNAYFVLGDNRGNSVDSLRGLGFIEKQQIDGVLKVVTASCDAVGKDDDEVCEGYHFTGLKFF